jgi:hypothetical protein
MSFNIGKLEQLCDNVRVRPEAAIITKLVVSCTRIHGAMAHTTCRPNQKKIKSQEQAANADFKGWKARGVSVL